MTTLGYYLRSYILGLWNDQPLSKEWIRWYDGISELERSRVEFEANNKQEFIDKVSKYMPHLNNKNIGSLYKKLKGSEVGVIDVDQSGLSCKLIRECKKYYFAAPPLLVKYSYHVLRISHCGEFNKNKIIGYYPNKFYLDYAFNNRYPKSYIDNKRHGEIEIKYKMLFEDKALDYAEKHWGYLLSRQPLMDFNTCHFSNPKVNYPVFGGAKKIFKLYEMLIRSKNDVNRDYDYPRFILDDNNLGLITHSKILAEELQGGQAGYSSSPKCIYCGSSLDIDNCPVCEIKFNKEQYDTYGGSTISNKVYWYIKDNENIIRRIFDIDGNTPIVPDQNKLIEARECYVNEIFKSDPELKNIWNNVDYSIKRDNKMTQLPKSNLISNYSKPFYKFIERVHRFFNFW